MPGQSDTIDADYYLADGFPIIIGTTKITLVYDDAWNNSETMPALRDRLVGLFQKASSDGFRLQTIVHEISCSVQDVLFPGSPNNWWTDGSAEYFSNLVYPQVDDEWRTARKYSPDIALYDNDAYAMNVFFQAMEQSNGIVGTHTWIRSHSDPRRECGREE